MNNTHPSESTKTSGGVFIPIGVKLIGIVSLILVFALVGMTVLATMSFTNDVERSVQMNTLDRADLIAQKLETELRAYISTGQIIAAAMNGGIVYQGTGASVTDQLLKQNPVFLEAWIVSQKDGAYVLDKRATEQERLDAAGIKLPDALEIMARYTANFTSSFAGAVVLENVSPEYNYPVLALAFPNTMKNEHQAESIMVLVFTMAQVLDSLQSRELYQSYLVDTRGILIASPDQKLVLARPSLKDSPIVKDCLTTNSENKQIQFKDEQGKLNLGSYKRFFDGRLTAFSTVLVETALANVYIIQWRNLLITAMILCVAILLLFFYSKTITLPVRRLVDGTNLVRDGNYDVKISVPNHDEIGRLANAFTGMIRGLAEREKIKSVFGKFVNKEIAERALRDDFKLGGESRRAAIFFSDIRSFTEISELLTPQEVVEFLNDYMTRMVDCVNKTQGQVNKYIGDAIMALWGVPVSYGNDTENAINGALMMRLALAEFNRDRGGPRKPIIRIGSGINTGEVIAGQIGSNERMEYTVIGDAVNLASRIEALNKPFRTDILISQNSYAEVMGIFKVEPMKKITVKGKLEPQQVYAVIGRLDDPACPSGLSEIRKQLGWEDVSLDAVDADSHEDKYEIIE